MAARPRHRHHLGHLHPELGERVQQGLSIRGIAPHDASHELAESLAIPITTLRRAARSSISAIDGADEVGPGLALIKGGGGALLREKIVASAATPLHRRRGLHQTRQALSVTFRLPVEVIQMALPIVERDWPHWN